MLVVQLRVTDTPAGVGHSAQHFSPESMLTTIESCGGFLVLVGFGLTKLGDVSAVDAVGWVLLGLGVAVALIAGVLDLAVKRVGD